MKSNQAKKRVKTRRPEMHISNSVRESNINFLVVVNLNLLYTVGENVDLCFCEFSCADPLLEEQVKLGESATAGLRYTEVSVNDAQEATASPEESGVVAPCPSAGVEHVRSQNTAHNADDVVKVTSEDDGLDLEAASGDLGDEGVADGTDGQLVTQGPDQHHGAGCERCRVLVSLGDESEEAHDEKHGAETAKTDQVESATTDSNAHEEPSAEHTSHVDTVLSNGEVHGLAGVESSLLEEIGRVTRE